MKDDESLGEKVFEPQMVASHDHRFGDVNEIQFLTSDVFAVASSSGQVSLLRIERDNASVRSTGYKLLQVNKWDNLHCSK